MMTAEQLRGELDALLQHHGVPLRARYGASVADLLGQAIDMDLLSRNALAAAYAVVGDPREIA